MSLSRRDFLKSAVAGAAVGLMGSELFAKDEPKKPNIIVFLVDDMGWTDSELYGSDFYESPNQKRLAKEGMLFTQAYAQPLCSPTRAAMMSGKYPGARLGLFKAITGGSVPDPKVPAEANPKTPMCFPSSRSHLPLEERTIAEALKDAGYQTWHFGKWHLGHSPKYYPVKQGFDLNVGVGGAGPTGGYFAPYHVPQFPQGPDGEYIAERMSQEACDLIEKKHKDGPFFMYYACFNVHAPYEAKRDLIDYYAKKAKRMGEGQHRNPIMAAMLHGMDDAMGKVMDKLDELKIAEETVILFVSDNGGVNWGMKRTQPGLEEWKGKPVTSNKPLRGNKCSYYEGGVRVPMIVRWPGRVKPGSRCERPVHIIDYYPTILKIAGGKKADKQILDGADMTPLLTGEGTFAERDLFCHFPRPSIVGEDQFGGSFIRRGDFKLLRIYGQNEDRSDRYELYNLKEDIGETKNLTEAMPDKVKELKAVLDTWLKETGALIPVKNPKYAG